MVVGAAEHHLGRELERLIGYLDLEDYVETFQVEPKDFPEDLTLTLSQLPADWRRLVRCKHDELPDVAAGE